MSKAKTNLHTHSVIRNTYEKRPRQKTKKYDCFEWKKNTDTKKKFGFFVCVNHSCVIAKRKWQERKKRRLLQLFFNESAYTSTKTDHFLWLWHYFASKTDSVWFYDCGFFDLFMDGGLYNFFLVPSKDPQFFPECFVSRFSLLFSISHSRI